MMIEIRIETIFKHNLMFRDFSDIKVINNVINILSIRGKMSLKKIESIKIEFENEIELSKKVEVSLPTKEKLYLNEVRYKMKEK